MAIECVQRCAASLVIREMQFKTTVKWYNTHPRVSKIKMVTSAGSVGEEQLECCDPVGRKVKCSL